jgi:hypothetical protein
MLFVLALPLAGVDQGALPKYEDYPTEAAFDGLPRAPNLVSHPTARQYRTVLRRETKRGPDFAGHFTIVRIGCGGSCNQIAVVDARTGAVYFPKGLSTVLWGGWWHEPYGPQYRRSSRLLVVYGLANSGVGPYGISYFVWDGQDFTRLAFQEQDPGAPPR